MRQGAPSQIFLSPPLNAHAFALVHRPEASRAALRRLNLNNNCACLSVYLAELMDGTMQDLSVRPHNFIEEASFLRR